MSQKKTERVTIPEYPFFMWGTYEEQTKVKHKVVSEYFDKWLKIVGKNSEVLYVDCFAGCGAYCGDDGRAEYGSPIKAAQIIKDNFSKLGRQARLILIDRDPDNLGNIKKILEYLQLEVECILMPGDYENNIISILSGAYGKLPTFFFVDPFGFKIKFSIIEKVNNPVAKARGLQWR
ncbi:three-Cys-motif partner protein TcmP [Desulfurispora thermophila]|uniref:three-Cys-motif partner protein TcmP n=1 Tax=Desulfurispora thermophila TaxID=265470 RepID=UPI000360797E|nr:three-Cys-motif partner protein TcmP [Desulfurispora thermophila]